MSQRPLNPWQGKRVPGTGKRAVARPTGARSLALRALLAFESDGVFVAKTLDEMFREFDTPIRDRRLATELASETLRRKFSLDCILANYVVRPRESVEPDLWLLLQMGVCQLLCLQHIPSHAAVHETVSLCDELEKSRAKGFVNGTLRALEREIVRPEDSASRLAEAPLLESLVPQVWPIQTWRSGTAEWRLVELSRPVFSDPRLQPVEYISQVASLPPWLLQRWEHQGASAASLLKLGLWFTTPGRLSLRVNLARTTRETVLEGLQGAGVTAIPGRLPESLLLEGTAVVADLPGFREGLFSVQDESAMLASDLLSPQPGESIVDLCAAPGGKSCHLAERLRGTGRVVACDVSADRLRTIDHNVQRLQLTQVETWALTPEGEFPPAGPFDAALVDVPCSNTGVLGKRPEARWRLTSGSFEELIPLQKRLLEQALNLVRPGGRVVYSTCSIDREENFDVVSAVLAHRPDVQLKSEVLHWPGDPADGGYQALLVKG